MRGTGAVLLLLAMSACNPSSALPNDMEAKIAAERALTARVEAEQRRCAATVRPAEGEAAAAKDAEGGEWRFVTYRHHQIGVYDEVPGIEGCEPLLPEGHDRLRQASACGEIVCSGIAQACKTAEIGYRAAYNRTLLARVKGVEARNCKPG